jgi:hypothetical protein
MGPGKEFEMTGKPQSASSLLFRATSLVTEPLRYRDNGGIVVYS